MALIFVTMLIIIIPNPQDKPRKGTAQFVFAGWDFPYDYSQGIHKIYVYENSTASWQSVDESPVYYYDDSIVDIPTTEETAIKLRPRAYIYPDIYGLLDYDDAKAIMRLNVTVTCLGETIFSQQNLTLEGTEETDGSLWYIDYEVVLNFLIEEYTIYNVYLTYEIYSAPSIETVYFNDCLNTTDFVYEDSDYLDPADYGLGLDTPFAIEYWIAPKDFFNIEQVVYKLDFDDIENSEGDLWIQIKYKVESASNVFKYRIYYNDTTKTDSPLGTSTTYWYLPLTPDSKTLDYFLLYNYATPASVSSGNYSVWLDSIRILDTDPTEEWNLITDVELSLSASMSEATEWAMNGWYILGGMGLVICSGPYLVKGGRSELSADKVYYALIAFIIGWALIIGVIVS